MHQAYAMPLNLTSACTLKLCTTTMIQPNISRNNNHCGAQSWRVHAKTAAFAMLLHTFGASRLTATSACMYSSHVMINLS